MSLFLDKREREFRGALRRIANTPDGKIILTQLHEDIVLLPTKGEYQEGIRDFKRMLLVASKVDFKELTINYEQENPDNG